MTTHHRVPTLPAQHARRFAAIAAAVFALAFIATLWGPVATVAGSVTVGLVLGAVVARPWYLLQWCAMRAMWARNDLPDLPPPPDLSRLLADVLPPALPKSVVFAAPREAPAPMPMLAPAQPPTVVLDLPPDYATELARTQSGPLPAVPLARWLTLAEMHVGDQFVLPNGASATLRTREQYEEFAWADMLSVTVDGHDHALTLPAAHRWRMVRAMRTAAVRCLVCGQATDDLAEHVYDLAVLTASVVAVCDQCERNTGGPA